MTLYGEELLVERSRRRISQTKLSKRSGVFVQTLVDIERNRIGIDEPTYNRLIEAMDAEQEEVA